MAGSAMAFLENMTVLHELLRRWICIGILLRSLDFSFRNFPFLLGYDCRPVRIFEECGVMLTMRRIGALRCLFAIRFGSLGDGGRALQQGCILFERQCHDLLPFHRTFGTCRQTVIFTDITHIMYITGICGCRTGSEILASRSPADTGDGLQAGLYTDLCPHLFWAPWSCTPIASLLHVFVI